MWLQEMREREVEEAALRAEISRLQAEAARLMTARYSGQRVQTVLGPIRVPVPVYEISVAEPQIIFKKIIIFVFKQAIIFREYFMYRFLLK